MATNFDKRVVGAVAVAAGGLLAADAHAALVYGTANVGSTVPNGGGIDLDINSDGQNDLNVSEINKNGVNRYYVNATQSTAKNPVVNTSQYAILPYTQDSDGNPAHMIRPQAFVAGQSVGPTQNYGFDTGGESNSLVGGANAGTGTGGYFVANDTEQFVGVQLTTTNGVFYGFVGLTLDPLSTTNKKATIKEYAYESNVGQAAVIPRTPEPASLAVLALGGLGLLARRRQA